MVSLLQRAGWRHLWRHPWQVGLAVLGVTLGIAVVVAVDLANTSATRAFELSMAQLYGRTTHQLVGGPGGVDQSLYVRLKTMPGAPPMAPVVETYATLDQQPVQLLGIDPFAEHAFRDLVGGVSVTSGDQQIATLLTEPGSVLLAAPTARRLNAQPGDRIELVVAGHQRAVHVVGLLESGSGGGAALEGLLVADIATAQELAGMLGRLSRIDLILDHRQPEKIRATLPAGVQLVNAAARSRATVQMSEAFRINLTAMGLLALVVAMFLIYNSVTFMVLQRRRLLGTLRALGVSRAESFRLVLREALWLGVVGTLLGLVLGALLGNGLVRLVTRTINDHYFVLTVTEYLVTPAPLLKGALLGVTATVLAALVPAFEAARVSPHAALQRSRIEARSHWLAPRLALAGLALLGAGGLLLWWSQRSLLVGFLALFLLLVGLALTIPHAVHAAVRAIEPLAAKLGVEARLTLQGIGASLSRTGTAIAALTLAVATSVGVGVMVDSFRGSVARWLQASLQADVYVSVVSPRSSDSGAALPAGLIEHLAALPQVRSVSRGRSTSVPGPNGSTDVFALELDPGLEPRYPLLQGDPAEVWQRFRAGDAVLVSEPLAWHRGVEVGDDIELLTIMGMGRFSVVGVYTDYGSEQGEVLMARSLYLRHFDDPGIDGLGLYRASDVSLDGLLDAVRREVAQWAPQRAIVVRSNAQLRELSLDIFDRTFAITNVLRLLAVLVAFVGILSALMALQLERAKEMAVLRATGFTPAQVWRMVTTQTTCMGFAAGVLAIPTGLILAALLIHVINRRAFGWSMDMTIAPEVLLQGVVLAVVAALLAGLWPGWRMARTRPAEALREE